MRLTVRVALAAGESHGHCAAVCVPHALAGSRAVVEADPLGNTFALPPATVSEFVVSVWKHDWSQLVDYKKVGIDTQKEGGEEAAKAGGVPFSVKWEYKAEESGKHGMTAEGLPTEKLVSEKEINRCLTRPRTYIGEVTLRLSAAAGDGDEVWGAAQRLAGRPQAVEVMTSGKRQVVRSWDGTVRCPVLTKADYALMQLSAGSLKTSVLLVKLDVKAFLLDDGSINPDAAAPKCFAFDAARGTWKAIAATAEADVKLSVAVEAFVDKTHRCKGAGYGLPLPVGGVLVVCGRMAQPAAGAAGEEQPVFAVREGADKKRTLGIDSFHPYWGEVIMSPRGVLELLKDGAAVARVQLPATDDEGWVSAQTHPVGGPPPASGGGRKPAAWPDNEVYLKWRRAALAGDGGRAPAAAHPYEAAAGSAAPPTQSAPVRKHSGARPKWVMKILGLRARKLVAADGNPPQAVVAGVVSGAQTSRFPATVPDDRGHWLWCRDPLTMFVEDPADAFGVTFFEEIDSLCIGTAYASLSPAQVAEAQAATVLTPLRIQMDLKTEGGDPAGDVELSFVLKRPDPPSKKPRRPAGAGGAAAAASSKGLKGRLLLSVAQYRGKHPFPPPAGKLPAGLKAPLDNWQAGALARVRVGARNPVMKSCSEGGNVVFELSRLRELVHVKAFNGGQITFTVEPNFKSASGFVTTNREGWVFLQPSPGPYFDKLRLQPDLGELYLRWTLEVLQPEYYDLPSGRDLEHHLAFMTLIQAQDAKQPGVKRVGGAAVKRPAAAAPSEPAGPAPPIPYVYLKLKALDIPASPAHAITPAAVSDVSAQINDNGQMYVAPMHKKVKLTAPPAGTQLRNLVLKLLGAEKEPLGAIVVVPLTQDPKDRYPITMNGLAIGTAALQWSAPVEEPAPLRAAASPPKKSDPRLEKYAKEAAAAKADLEHRAGQVEVLRRREAEEQARMQQQQQRQPPAARRSVSAAASPAPRAEDAGRCAELAAEVARLKAALREAQQHGRDKAFAADDAAAAQVEKFRTENAELRDDLAALQARHKTTLEANRRLQDDLDAAAKRRPGAAGDAGAPRPPPPAPAQKSAAMAAMERRYWEECPEGAPIGTLEARYYRETPTLENPILEAKAAGAEAELAEERRLHEATKAELERITTRHAMMETSYKNVLAAGGGGGDRRHSDPAGVNAHVDVDALTRDNAQLSQEAFLLRQQLRQAEVVHAENQTLRRQLTHFEAAKGADTAPPLHAPLRPAAARPPPPPRAQDPADLQRLRDENAALQASLKQYTATEARIGVLEGLLATSQDTQQQQLLQIERMKSDLKSSARVLAQVLQRLPPEEP